KGHCHACIGQEQPAKWLEGEGLFLAPGQGIRKRDHQDSQVSQVNDTEQSEQPAEKNDRGFVMDVVAQRGLGHFLGMCLEALYQVGRRNRVPIALDSSKIDYVEE